MNIDRYLKGNRLSINLEGIKPMMQARISCTFPITIKGFNMLGERYDDTALVENVSRRGICFKSGQYLTTGSIITLYGFDEEIEPIATFEIAWSIRENELIKRFGAQLIGDNSSWIRYLTEDLILLEEPSLARS